MSIEFILKSVLIGFEGDGDGTGDKDGDGDGTPKTYTEEEFNAHMGGLRRKYEGQLTETKKTQKALATELEKLKQMKGLSDDERQSLQSRIDELESNFMTEQEKTERRAKEERDRHAQQVETLTTEATTWKQRFEKETVRNQIGRAAEKNKARSFQVEAILQPMVAFEEVKDDDGDPTGEIRPVVNFPDVDTKTKKPIVMKYSIDEAVERMKELADYENLFDDTSKGGLGGSRNVSQSQKDLAQVAKNPAEYRRLRSEGKLPLGS